MKRAIIWSICFVSLLASVLMGMFAAMGVCAAVFGSEIIETVLRAKPEPNPTHPAFITFMFLTIPGMLVGGCGALFGIILPLHQWFRVPLEGRNEGTRAWLHVYAKRLADFTQPNGEQTEPQ